MHVEGVPRNRWECPEAEVDPGKRPISLVLTVAEAETFAAILQALIERLGPDHMTDAEYRAVAGPATILAIRAQVQRSRAAEGERNRHEQAGAAVG